MLVRKPRLNDMISDLKDWKRELLPSKDADGVDSLDPNLDDFQRKSLALTRLLEEIRPVIYTYICINIAHRHTDVYVCVCVMT